VSQCLEIGLMAYRPHPNAGIKRLDF